LGFRVSDFPLQLETFMSPVLWLAFERPPHPQAVCHPATGEEVRLVLELFERPAQQRQHLADTLQRYVSAQAKLTPWQRPCIPCRRTSGLYMLIPWRLAQWLSAVLGATDGLIERTQRRLEAWLARRSGASVLQATG
jgi:hypothetical protein